MLFNGKIMAKWQFDLQQEGETLRTYGGSKDDVYNEIGRMSQEIGSHLKSTQPYKIWVSRTNRPCGRKQIVETIEGQIGSTGIKKKKPRRTPK